MFARAVVLLTFPEAPKSILLHKFDLPYHAPRHLGTLRGFLVAHANDSSSRVCKIVGLSLPWENMQ